jgi:hypothetical protein
LAYLKIDGAYIRSIDEQTDKRRFIGAKGRLIGPPKPM